MSSSRPQTRSPFSPQQTPNLEVAPKVAPKKAGREPAPFVLVPDSLVTDDDQELEPHWKKAIDTATD